MITCQVSVSVHLVGEDDSAIKGAPWGSLDKTAKEFAVVLMVLYVTT